LCVAYQINLKEYLSFSVYIPYLIYTFNVFTVSFVVEFNFVCLLLGCHGLLSVLYENFRFAQLVGDLVLHLHNTT